VINDVIRRKKRVLYAAFGVVVATMTVIGILTISLAAQSKIIDQLDKYGPNLTVIPAINNVDMRLGNLSLGTLSVGENYIPEDELPQIQQIADSEIRASGVATGFGPDEKISTVAPKLYINSEINDVPVMMVGIDPLEEWKVKTWWVVAEGEFLKDPDQVMLGQVAADTLALNIGDQVSVNGTDVTVIGILEESGSNDDYQVFVPLATAQATFGKEGLISSTDIRALCNGCPVETIADAINSNITGVRAIAVKQVAAAEMGMMDRVNRFMLTLAGITLLVGAFGVVNTMMASVNERIKDIGIMRAVGASRNQILKVFIYEAIIIGVIGGIFGYLLGTLLAYIIGPVIFEGIQVTYILTYLPVSLGLATFIAIIAAGYPAFRATKVKVADSFRSM
jgi:putative ABC transport system permease protein